MNTGCCFCIVAWLVYKLLLDKLWSTDLVGRIMLVPTLLHKSSRSHGVHMHIHYQIVCKEIRIQDNTSSFLCDVTELITNYSVCTYMCLYMHVHVHVGKTLGILPEELQTGDRWQCLWSLAIYGSRFIFGLWWQEGLCVIVCTCRCLLHLMTFEFMHTYTYIMYWGI